MAGDGGEGTLAQGTLVGGYRVERRIGGGGMGTVYEAIEPTIGKRVAIKVMRWAFAEDGASVARFEREARAAGHVKHPAIVDVFAFGRLPDGRPYLVMSLLEGRSLRDEIAARGRVPLADAWTIARTVADALAAAHEAGVIHRDLKPDNVFLEAVPARHGASGLRPRVLDFGLAKIADTEGAAPQAKLTQSGVPMGTPAYMAPEQWWNAGVDARTDQYAFGVLLFEMLAGRPPFASDQFAQLVQSHLHDAPPSLADVGVTAPPAVEALVARALAKSGEERFVTMSDLIDAGDAAFAGSGSFAPPPSSSSHPAFAPTMAATPPIIPTPVARPPAPGEAGRAPWLRFAALHALVLAAGFVAVRAVGYAGEVRHDMGAWMLIAGFGSLASLGWFALGALGLVALSAARARTGRTHVAVYWLALMPAVSGAIGTYLGWVKVVAVVGTMAPTERLGVLNLGGYETNASRFIGFALSAALLVSLAALPGVLPSGPQTGTLPGGRAAHGATIAGCLSLVALCGLSLFLGAPSAALVAGVGAVALGTALALPLSGSGAADAAKARNEIERAAATVIATGLAVAVAFARIEARESILWAEQPTRAERVAEIVAAAAERASTSWLVAAAAVVIAAALAVRVGRVAPAFGRPGRATWALLAVAALAVTADLTFHARFASKRDALHAEMAEQFALFARLDPPLAEGLTPERFAPRRAPALQIARDWVAINGTRVARLAALESEAGATNVGRDLSHAIAGADVEDGSPDLSISIDREVPYDMVARLLSVAREAGARRVELLLTRGATPSIPEGAPAEASYAMARDFVGLPADLADQGFAPPAGATFGDAAPALARMVEGPSRLVLAAPSRR